MSMSFPCHDCGRPTIGHGLDGTKWRCFDCAHKSLADRMKKIPADLKEVAIDDMAKICQALGDEAPHIEFFVGAYVRCKGCGETLILPDSRAVAFARDHSKHGGE